ncbi:hypothetical protein [Pseudofrankia sp. BMG5.36]|uniref:hypothetical protein n=1 Tax=Pseudofrankia sp. BMG5.36 TaxID=1834512 RepID=UPI0008DAD825|nr:hypothetical protein [Pseudofrankia sp. BMG5.36]OHV60827.1 hypothetical protein BCD48_40380 [Pseudofrankia sp. BMG5.36]
MTNDRARAPEPGGTQLLWLVAVAAGCLLTWAACAGVGAPSYRTCAAAAPAAHAPQPAAARAAAPGPAAEDPAFACGPAS